MWTTLLDPRFSLKSSNWRDEGEKATVKNLLMSKVEHLAVQQAYTTYSLTEPDDSSASNMDSKDENAICLFGEIQCLQDSPPSNITMREKAQASAKQEVLSYLVTTEAIVKRS
eukprot:CAMPEP_0118713924 /NCGR_PEP_ID=MMETSP0800-20121206/25846_1 /TAXON_ID=210618 ORGANISM="Striatella unipunctata, Strain CCMP2910" /NCGR_SAMPLE_ID=MMETSP0800 /ASSEMBLY_ACC=CAM_ASM_000638 /LENGTH=112 /DNA_ID=CAMNT_0006619549 /DNA_START=33 /DNA_END=371 /DNA_ORIENTATION=+